LLKEEGLNFQDQSSLAKHLGATDEVWCRGYQVYKIQKRGIGGPNMSWPTLDTDKEAHDQGSLKIIIR
jgi:hypothetical protein